VTPHKPRILLIEDDSVFRETVSMAFGRKGLVVDSAGDGSEGLALVQMNAYCSVLLDMMLPTTSGFAVVDAMKLTGSQVPVLVLTGTAVDRTALDASIVKLVIRKPADLDDLADLAMLLCDEHCAVDA
jgi:DNA-binding response OmpR family regulator